MPERQGLILRRIGLVLVLVWLLVLILIAGDAGDAGDAGENRAGAEVVHRLTFTLGMVAVHSWGYLGAAVVVYIAGVQLGLRHERPVQLPYRLGRGRTGIGGLLVPLAVIAAAVAALAVAVVQEAGGPVDRVDAASDQQLPESTGQEPAVPPPTSTRPARVSCAPFASAAPAPMQPEPVTDIPAGELQIRDRVAGTGRTVAAGDTVAVHYTMYLCSTGRQADARLGEALPLPLDQVIKGWAEGITGMKVGGRRQLVVPPELAYGAEGHPPEIPADETLVFVVEVLDTQPSTPPR